MWLALEAAAWRPRRWLAASNMCVAYVVIIIIINGVMAAVCYY